MAQKPSNTPDWIPDNTTGIIIPGTSKQSAGWFKEERPPYQFFNWFWNIVSQFIHYFSGEAEYNIIIDTDANEGDYTTLAAYIADSPAAGDRVLVKVDEEITGSTMVIPDNIQFEFLKGKKLWCDENLTTVLQFGNNIITKGDLVLELSHTGTVTKAVSINGNSNSHCHITVKNISTGDVTSVFVVESDKGENILCGEVVNSSTGIVINNLVDNSSVSSNDIRIKRSGCAVMSTDKNNLIKAGMSVRNWTGRTAASVNPWESVCWSPELNLLVAVSSGGTVMTSPNGANWTSRTAAESNSWNDVCWSPDLSLFCAVSGDGTNRVMTSPNGINWTARAHDGDMVWRAICWSPDLTLFVVVASGGIGGHCMTSPDGINWTQRTLADEWRDVCWSPEVGLFCAVSSTATNRVVTSPNGINWTGRTAPLATWRSIVWSPEHGLFVSVGDGVVMTSPDGINWTSRTPGAVNDWYSVTWSPELGIFCSVSNDGTNRVMTSYNGIYWTNQPATEASTWNSVCWALELGFFVAVALSGTNRVMHSL